MSRGEETAKRRFWRPRFSLRTLAIIVTLVCAYFAAWEVTKRYVAREQSRNVPNVLATRAIAPLLIARDTVSYGVTVNGTFNASASKAMLELPDGGSLTASSFTILNARTHYYVWFLGPMVKLPYESNADPFTLLSGEKRVIGIWK
jgi:hypothetical protein